MFCAYLYSGLPGRHLPFNPLLYCARVLHWSYWLSSRNFLSAEIPASM